MKNSPQAVVYCDASVKPKHHNGIGICLLDRSGRLVAKVSRRVLGYSRNITALEGRGVFEGIALAAKHGFTNIRVYTDNRGLACAAANGRGTTAVVRRFVRILNEVRSYIKVSLVWVRGHAGNKWNTTCDRLARNAQWTFTQMLSVIVERIRLKKTPEEALPQSVRKNLKSRLCCCA